MNRNLQNFFETVTVPETFPNLKSLKRDRQTGDYMDPEVQKLWAVFQDGAEAAAYDAIEILEATTDPGYVAADQVARHFEIPRELVDWQ